MAVRKGSDPTIFLNQLNWDANMGKLNQIDTFRMDVYQFAFEEPLKGESLQDFTGYIRTLPMDKVRTVMKIWVWLYQKGIRFELKFSWNENLSIFHNLKSVFGPERVNHKLRSFSHEELMACKLERS